MSDINQERYRNLSRTVPKKDPEFCDHQLIYVSPKGKKKCCSCEREFEFSEI